MLLFYEHEPDSTEFTPFNTPPADATPPIQPINPLPQYTSHAFIPYLPPSQPSPSNNNTEPPLTLHNTSSWTYSGPLLSPSASSLPPSFHTWTSTTLSSPELLLSRLLPLLSFLHTFLSTAGAKHYWLTLRATKPTSTYNTPRWHMDDNFFTRDPDAAFGMGFSPTSTTGTRAWKLAATLLGPGTLFVGEKYQKAARDVVGNTKEAEMNRLDMQRHACTSIRCLGCATYADCVRERLAVLLSSMQSEMPGYGEVAFFRIGGEEGAVHSEPKCDVDRIFVNVVPGTERDLRALMGRWGMGFPRAWCFGVPVGFVPSDEEESFCKTARAGGG